MLYAILKPIAKLFIHSNFRVEVITAKYPGFKVFIVAVTM